MHVQHQQSPGGGDAEWFTNARTRTTKPPNSDKASNSRATERLTRPQSHMSLAAEGLVSVEGLAADAAEAADSSKAARKKAHAAIGKVSCRQADLHLYIMNWAGVRDLTQKR